MKSERRTIVAGGGCGTGMVMCGCGMAGGTVHWYCANIGMCEVPEMLKLPMPDVATWKDNGSFTAGKWPGPPTVEGVGSTTPSQTGVFGMQAGVRVISRVGERTSGMPGVRSKSQSFFREKFGGTVAGGVLTLVVGTGDP